jgi:hypothetical protein
MMDVHDSWPLDQSSIIQATYNVAPAALFSTILKLAELDFCA